MGGVLSDVGGVTFEDGEITGVFPTGIDLAGGSPNEVGGDTLEEGEATPGVGGVTSTVK